MSKKKKLIISIVSLLVLVAVQIYFLSSYDHFKAKGGLKVDLAIDPEDVTKKYVRPSLDYDYVMEDAIRSHKQNGGDFLAVFAESNKKRLQRPLIRLLNYKEIAELNMNSTDDEVIDFLRDKMDANLDAAAFFFQDRMDAVSKNSVDIDHSSEELSITMRLTGQKDDVELKYFELPKVEVGFYECLSINQIGSIWNTLCLYTEPDSIPEAERELIDLNKSSKQSTQSLENSVNWEMGSFGQVLDENKKYVEELIESPVFDSIVPEEVEFRWSEKPNLFGQVEAWNLYAIKLPVSGFATISNADIKSAKFEAQGSYGDPVLGIRMTQEGAEKWAKMTEENIGRIIAMCVNGEVYSAPNVIGAIMDGNTQITGSNADKLKEIETALSYRSLDVSLVGVNQTVIEANPPILNSMMLKILLAVSILLLLFFGVQLFRASRSI